MTPEEALAMARECADIGYAQTLAQAICLDVAELPDRTSPHDWPDAMLVTADELTEIVIRQSQERMEERVRAETERCAALADDHSFALDIDTWMTMTKKDISAYACRSVAAAIRETPHAEG